MSGWLGLYGRLFGAQLRSRMQYRVSFFLETMGDLVVSALDFAALYILLGRFQRIDTWGLPEIAFLYGTSAVSFGLAEFFSGAFQDFDRWVSRGDFDRLLLRPLPIAFQMLTGDFQFRRFGRFLQGALALALALHLLHPSWDAGRWLFFGVMLAGGVLVFLAVFILGATAAFWTPQTAELVNMFTYGGQFMTSYPMYIYQAWIRSIFTFIIPMAFINYYPAVFLLGKRDPLGLPGFVPFLAPAAAGALFLAAMGLWRSGVRHYQSTGS